MSDLLRSAALSAVVVFLAATFATLLVGAGPYPWVMVVTWAAGTLYLWGQQ